MKGREFRSGLETFERPAVREGSGDDKNEQSNSNATVVCRVSILGYRNTET